MSLKKRTTWNHEVIQEERFQNEHDRAKLKEVEAALAQLSQTVQAMKDALSQAAKEGE